MGKARRLLVPRRPGPLLLLYGTAQSLGVDLVSRDTGRHTFWSLPNDVAVQFTVEQPVSSHHLASITKTATFAAPAEDRRLWRAATTCVKTAETFHRNNPEQEMPYEATDNEPALDRQIAIEFERHLVLWLFRHQQTHRWQCTNRSSPLGPQSHATDSMSPSQFSTCLTILWISMSRAAGPLNIVAPDAIS